MSNIKDLLGNYNRNKFEISNLEMKLKILLEEESDSSEISKIKEKIKNKKAMNDKVDYLISNLGVTQQYIVTQRAFKKRDFFTIAKEINFIQEFDSTHCREVYDMSCKSMQDLLDGMESQNENKD